MADDDDFSWGKQIIIRSCRHKNKYLYIADADDFDPDQGFKENKESDRWEGEDEGIELPVSKSFRISCRVKLTSYRNINRRLYNRTMLRNLVQFVLS